VCDAVTEVEVGIGERYPRLRGFPPALDWLRSLSDLARAPRTIDAYARGVSDHVDYCGRAGVDLVAASRTDVAGYLRDLRERPAPAGAQDHRTPGSQPSTPLHHLRHSREHLPTRTPQPTRRQDPQLDPVHRLRQVSRSRRRHLTKGDCAGVSGELVTSEWTDGEHRRHFKLEVSARTVGFLDRERPPASASTPATTTSESDPPPSGPGAKTGVAPRKGRGPRDLGRSRRPVIEGQHEVCASSDRRTVRVRGM
jgi:hypothetical protein